MVVGSADAVVSDGPAATEASTGTVAPGSRCRNRRGRSTGTGSQPPAHQGRSARCAPPPGSCRPRRRGAPAPPAHNASRWARSGTGCPARAQQQTVAPHAGLQQPPGQQTQDGGSRGWRLGIASGLGARTRARTATAIGRQGLADGAVEQRVHLGMGRFAQGSEAGLRNWARSKGARRRTTHRPAGSVARWRAMAARAWRLIRLRVTARLACRLGTTSPASGRKDRTGPDAPDSSTSAPERAQRLWITLVTTPG
jgi:hypothetical protein